jgi:hypothetical protein
LRLASEDGVGRVRTSPPSLLLPRPALASPLIAAATRDGVTTVAGGLSGDTEPSDTRGEAATAAGAGADMLPDLQWNARRV